MTSTLSNQPFLPDSQHFPFNHAVDRYPRTVHTQMAMLLAQPLVDNPYCFSGCQYGLLQCIRHQYVIMSEVDASILSCWMILLATLVVALQVMADLEVAEMYCIQIFLGESFLIMFHLVMKPAWRW